MKTTAALAFLSIFSLTGCDLWFGQNHCDDSFGAADFEAIGVLDPQTAQCIDQGGGGGGGICGDFADDALEPVPQQDFALCYSQCTELTEDECLTAPGCRAGYVSDCPEGWDCDSTTYTFHECWATAPSGPVQGACSGLDAYECSRHDDCIAYHYQGTACDGGTGSGNCLPDPTPGLVGNFELCVDEASDVVGCYGDEECSEGYSCNAAEVCQSPPGCDPSVGCPDVCYGYCVPDEVEAVSCYSDVVCDSVPPACPAGTVPGIQNDCWTGDCILYEACEPALDPGTCSGEVFCDGLPPACPEGSVPGVLDGCWSNLCIPSEQCEDV